MELIKLDKSIVLKRQTDGKITLRQLTRVYIYLAICHPRYDFKNANFQMPFFRDKMPKLQGVEVNTYLNLQCSFVHLFTVHWGMIWIVICML